MAVCCISLGSMVYALPSPFLTQHHARVLRKSLMPLSLFFSRGVTTAICHTKNTLKETVSAKHQYTLISTSPILISLFSPAPPSATLSWENSKDNTVHAPKSYKSVSRKSLLIRVRLAKARRMVENENENRKQRAG